MIPYSEKTTMLLKYISELTQLAIDNGDTRWLKRNTFSIREPDGVLNEKMRAYAKRQYKLKLAQRGATAVNITYSANNTFRLRVTHPGLGPLCRQGLSGRTITTTVTDPTLKASADKAIASLRAPMSHVRGGISAGYVIFTTGCITFGNEYGNCTYTNPRGSNSRIYMFKERLSHTQIVNSVDVALQHLNEYNDLLNTKLAADEQFINPEGKTFIYTPRAAEKEFLSKHFVFNEIKDISELYVERKAN